MPFVARGTPPDFAPKAFCCLKIGGKWKLHHCEDGKWKRVYTGLPEDATECSPTAELVDGRWRISFIAGGHESDRRFYLYKIDGIGNVPERVVSADVGFVFKNRIVYGGRSGGLYIVNGERIQKLTSPDVEYLYRVSYNPDNPSEWLISGQTKAGGIFSRVCNVFAGTLQDLCVNGKPAYKAALFNGRCFYAERGENGFEDRRIVEAAEFARTDLEFEKSAILETLDTLPTTFQMVGKFTKATYNWAKSGLKLADETEQKRRKSICNNCKFWHPTARMGLGKCLKCGCSSAKLKLASESCPIGKW